MPSLPLDLTPYREALCHAFFQGAFLFNLPQVFFDAAIDALWGASGEDADNLKELLAPLLKSAPPKEAICFLEKQADALSGKKRAETLTCLASLQALSDPEAALLTLEKALSAKSGYFQARLLSGLISLHLGDKQTATQALLAALLEKPPIRPGLLSFKKAAPSLCLYQMLALGGLAAIERDKGDLKEAAAYHDQALSLAPKDAAQEEAAHYSALGDIYRLGGLLDTADQLFRSAEGLYQKEKTLAAAAGLADLTAYKAFLACLRQDMEGAISLHEESLAMNEKLERGAAIAAQTANLAMALAQEGKSDRALSLLKEAVVKYDARKMPLGAAACCRDMGQIYAHMDKADEALAALEKGLTLYRAADRKNGMADCLLSLGSILTGRDPVRAEEALKEALSLNRQKERQASLASTCSALGLCLMQQDKLVEAAASFKEAISCEETLHRGETVAADYANLGLAQAKMGKKDSADKAWQKAADIFTPEDNQAALAQIESWRQRYDVPS